MVRDYYYSCLKPYYRYGVADLGGRGNSEAQSYGLLQSLWMDDKRTFRDVWLWTKENLQRQEDYLFSWDFDLKHDLRTFPAKKAVIKDYNSASDADEDIAMALFLAGEAWEKPGYITEAKKIIAGIWRREVYEHQGLLYLLPGAWGAENNQIVVNPSYFSPAAYKIFAKYDPNHDWNKLASDSYAVLERIRGGINRGEFNDFPPNWVVIDKNSGRMTPFTGKADSLDYSYDAFRTLWRSAYDQLTVPSLESWDYISSLESEIRRDWEDDQLLCTLYNFDGRMLLCNPAPTGLSGLIGVLSVSNGFLAEQVVKRNYLLGGKLQFPEDNFYGQSWHWFGVYLFTRS